MPALNFIGLASFNKAVRHIPKPWSRAALSEGRNARFVAYMAEAEGVFRRALELEPSQPEVLRWNLATALEWLGASAEANRLLSDPSAETAGDQIKASFLNRSIRRPVKISEVSPEYTALARASRVTGTVILQIVIDEEGRIGSVHVLKGLTGLTAEAIKAVRQWHYTPTTPQRRKRANPWLSSSI